jgi:hypothetical protein
VFALTVAACNDKAPHTGAMPSASAADTRATELLKDVSDVWSSKELGLVTIAYSETEKSLQFLLGDTPTVMRLGDVDPQSERSNGGGSAD